MVKILSQAGISLADMYDVQGSIAGIDQLDTRELTIVHEVGATIFSERFRTTILRVTTGDILQSAGIALPITDLPNAITRILGVQVFSDDGSRIADLQCSVAQPTPDQDFPIWAFDVGNVRAINIRDLGVTLPVELLLPEPGLVLPSFFTPALQGLDPVNQFVMRGNTTAFGAGTVFVTALVHVGFTFSSGISAFGARVPSW